MSLRQGIVKDINEKNRLNGASRKGEVHNRYASVYTRDVMGFIALRMVVRSVMNYRSIDHS
jgi:hypothetical protein